MKQMSLDFDRPRVSAVETPDLWLKQLFSAQAARDGHVVRRRARDIERYAGWDRFFDELARRGYRALENDGQVLVICNRAPIRMLFDLDREG